MKRFDLARDILDKQVVDRKETKMGRVDGIVLELGGGRPPRIDSLELGLVVLARRVHPRLERWVEALRRRFSVRKTARQRVPWSQVIEVSPHYVRLDLEALKTPAFDWERWLRDHVVAKVPGEK